MGVNGLVGASVQLEVGVFPKIVDSLSVVVMSVGVVVEKLSEVKPVP